MPVRTGARVVQALWPSEGFLTSRNRINTAKKHKLTAVPPAYIGKGAALDPTLSLRLTRLMTTSFLGMTATGVLLLRM